MRAREGGELHTSSTSRVKFGFLFSGFEPDFYFWESVVMLRKVAVAAIAVFLNPLGVTSQIYAALLVVVLLLTVQALIQPFLIKRLNRLELLGLATAFVTLMAGLFLEDSDALATGFRVTDAEAIDSIAVGVTLVIVGSNAFFLLAGLSIIAIEIQRQAPFACNWTACLERTACCKVVCTPLVYAELRHETPKQRQRRVEREAARAKVVASRESSRRLVSRHSSRRGGLPRSPLRN